MSRDDRRQQLLSHARDEFVESGYHDASMDDIARRAGVSKPVLYQHFPGKRELYLDLLDEGVAQVREVLAVALNRSEDVETLVHDTLDTYFSLVAAGDSGFRLALQFDLTNEKEAVERLRGLQRWSIEAITKRLDEVAGIADPPARVLATGLVGLAHYTSRVWFLSGAENQADTVDMYARLAWGGLREFVEGASAPAVREGSGPDQ